MITTARLRHIAQINPGTPAFDKLDAGDDVTFLPMEAVWPDSRLDLSRRRTKKSVITGYTRFQDGDILVPKITPTFQASRAVLIGGLHSGVGAGSTELHVVRPGKSIDPRYLLYLFHTHSFLKLGEAEMYGVAGQQRVPDDFLRDFPVPLLSLAEQRRIADFLDAETARINLMSQLRRSQLGTLEERYVTAIAEVTTPGISTARPRSTTWPWLPEDLATVRLGYLARVQSGVTVHGARAKDPEDAVFPYLRVANVQGERLDLTEIKKITLPRSMAIRSMLQPGDVVMTEANGNPDNLGRGAVWHGQVANMVHQNHVFAIRVDRDKLVPDYLSALLATTHGRRYFRFTSTQVGIATTSSSKVLDFPVPVRTLSQQRDMVGEYEALRSATDRTRSALAHQLDLLEERRRSLITAAVTGQFDVTTASGRNVTEGVAV